MTKNRHPGQNKTINPSSSKHNDPTKLPQNNDTATLPQKSDSTKISSTSNQQKKRKKAEVSDNNERLRSSVLDLQCQKLNEHLVFYGIDEQTDEVTDDLVKAFVRTELEIVREIPIVKSYIIGKHFDGKIRPIVVKFENRNDRQDIRFAAPKHLKGKPFGVNEHFPHEVVKIRKELLPIHKEARKQKLKSVLKRDKLYIDGELFDKTKHSHLIKQLEAMDEGGAQGGDNGN
ncbi:unnamed protein product [Mytilus coruscus]|uniref:Uncharacterized protein n=1 Tax=Mytilus coruscus TaxID=42192 RepID=A0A6J8CCC7_MYTCO|nr:unnamed protein product [Mytilus coruscus]